MCRVSVRPGLGRAAASLQVTARLGGLEHSTKLPLLGIVFAQVRRRVVPDPPERCIRNDDHTAVVEMQAYFRVLVVAHASPSSGSDLPRNARTSAADGDEKTMASTDPSAATCATNHPSVRRRSSGSAPSPNVPNKMRYRPVAFASADNS